ncbi:BlaI/MecI/CopY family transcriptional regulator [Marinifilum sp. N1E240]|uniref:BlaI/MecI/CopY family transcriptional regulator n=1 Tax=Marinifilum sp. N1E240 TaxID=2608082 RepID=UPI00128BD247|nr:BlaI/MecI/CopY family transcriptional regulator [Marinifilum sp. N1E240]MPQ47787.1 BlaI/MecI/CopY family transcriptional regulator [Marinifilum sp. N1E240]
MDIKSLTKAEEQIMQIIWLLQEATVKNVIENFDGDKPAYTTVATVLSVLEKKGFVTHRKIGNTKLFTPEVSKANYTKVQFGSLLRNYFNGSFPKMASFFARENDMDISDLENIMKQAEEEFKHEQQKED